MRLSVSKAWSERRIEKEGSLDVGAGIPRLSAAGRISIIRERILKGSACFGSEKDLQDWIQKRLESCLALRLQRELSLSKKERPDFFADGTAIEAKTCMSRTAAFRQLERYARLEAVDSLVLIIPRIRAIPETINNKPCAVLELWPLMI